MIVDLFWSLCKLLMAVIVIVWPLYMIAGIIYISVRVYQAVQEMIAPIMAKAVTAEECEIKFRQVSDHAMDIHGDTVAWSAGETVPASTGQIQEQVNLNEVYGQKSSELDELEASITEETSHDEISDEVLEEIANSIPSTGELNENELDDLANSL